MTTLRTVFLACLALTPMAAQAQTHAPAEDRPGRIVLVPMSVERPAGAGWALVRRTDTDLTFLHPADKEHNSLVAIASGKVPDKRLRSTDELAALLRKDLKEKTDPRRFEVFAEEVRPDAAPDRKCVRYRQQARDLAAIGADGKAQLIDLYGQVCLHPADEGILLAVTLSERAPADGAGKQNIAEMAERFFRGMRAHAPLKGRDWQPLAEQGDANAQVWLARTLMQTNELEEAIVWLGRAADKGHVDAQALLGLSYLTGRAVTRSPEDALKWLRMAAEKSYPKAEGLLGLTLITAAEVRNEEEGRRWVRKAAADGDPFGQALLGELLLFGKAGMEKNETEGAAWVRNASEQGEAKAQYMLAGLLYNGIGSAKDPVQSRFWLDLAAAQGHPEARKLLEQARRASRPAPVPTPAESK
ncbi:MAG: sel1 repeat family protein [Rhodocyclales bacterium]|nr:sel1 repeat family protein [Rhodocyclales bacterium]